METHPFELREVIKAASLQYKKHRAPLAPLHSCRSTHAFVTPKFKYLLFYLVFLTFSLFFFLGGGCFKRIPVFKNTSK